jgi:hypothetical protein
MVFMQISVACIIPHLHVVRNEWAEAGLQTLSEEMRSSVSLVEQEEEMEGMLLPHTELLQILCKRVPTQDQLLFRGGVRNNLFGDMYI